MSGEKQTGDHGRAIVQLVAWLKSDGTAKALETMQLLDLSDEDLELLFETNLPKAIIRIPFLGKVK